GHAKRHRDTEVWPDFCYKLDRGSASAASREGIRSLPVYRRRIDIPVKAGIRAGSVAAGAGPDYVQLQLDRPIDLHVDSQDFRNGNEHLECKDSVVQWRKLCDQGRRAHNRYDVDVGRHESQSRDFPDYYTAAGSGS